MLKQLLTAILFTFLFYQGQCESNIFGLICVVSPKVANASTLGSITFGKISEKPLATLALATLDDMAHIVLVLYALLYPR
jgi:hypothetical protein